MERSGLVTETALKKKKKTYFQLTQVSPALLDALAAQSQGAERALSVHTQLSVQVTKAE